MGEKGTVSSDFFLKAREIKRLESRQREYSIFQFLLLYLSSDIVVLHLFQTLNLRLSGGTAAGVVSRRRDK